MQRETISCRAAIFTIAAAFLIPVSSAAEDTFFNRPLDSIYFDAHGNFDRHRYFHDLDSMASEISASLKSTGVIGECIINPFWEPDTARDIGWDRSNQDPPAAVSRKSIVNTGFWESVVDEISYIRDTFVCADFTRATQIEFSGFLREVDQSSTAHALYDTIVAANRFNVPSYYVGIRGPDFAHAVTGFMVGNDVSNFNDWYLVEPQNDRPVEFGAANFPLSTSVVMIYQPIYSCAYDDTMMAVAMLTFVVDGGDPEMGWINEHEHIVTTRPSETNVLPFWILKQNYPNPFNAYTTITYNLPASCHVRLKIYNILGQCVRTIVDAHQPGGGYTREIDMSGYASGIYTYRLQTSDYTLSRKMVLVK
ncbi:MAG: T9SS type A sorting domain-containing protein [Candidatus Zixiibacteriota bacterium]|nr:MAG: T9SS type A sorting domain-containing protein [candidate division Zixibacteria bacterium]